MLFLISKFAWIFLATFVSSEMQFKRTSPLDSIARKSEDAVPRIVNGIEATAAQGQHQVSLRLSALENVQYGSGFICSGVLISEQIVLTAAHCTFYRIMPFCPSQLQVVIGGLNRVGYSSNSFIRQISKITVFENNNPVRLENDIAILKLETPLELPQTGIEPISLASERMPEGTQCHITGWGITEYGSASASELLLVAPLEILSTDYCNSSEFYGSISHPLLPGMICAGVATGGASCSGDSGGPLVCNNQLVGLVLGGFCGSNQFPDFFADVYYYKEWIAQNSGVIPRFMHRAWIFESFAVVFINFIFL